VQVKGLGYLVSIVSVFLLGLAAWPAKLDETVKMALILCGGGASVIGMFLRYLSHRKEKRTIAEANGKA